MKKVEKQAIIHEQIKLLVEYNKEHISIKTEQVRRNCETIAKLLECVPTIEEVNLTTITPREAATKAAYAIDMQSIIEKATKCREMKKQAPTATEALENEVLDEKFLSMVPIGLREVARDLLQNYDEYHREITLRKKELYKDYQKPIKCSCKRD